MKLIVSLPTYTEINVGLQLMIIFVIDSSIHYFLNKLVSCLGHKMSENGEKCQPLFAKAQDDILENIQFIVIKD